MGGCFGKNTDCLVLVPEMTFKLNRLSGDGHRYQDFIASVSRAGRHQKLSLRTRKCIVTVHCRQAQTLVKLVEESVAEALADGTVSVAANFRPYSKHSDAFTLKNINELMEVAVDNLNILVELDELTMEL